MRVLGEGRFSFNEQSVIQFTNRILLSDEIL